MSDINEDWMMTFEIVLVLLGLVGMVAALILDKMRPGMVLFSVVVLFLCAGILTPKEMLEGFSNKGMITVALLYLVSEGIRQSGALGQLIKKLVAASEENNGFQGPASYVANHFFHFCFSEQYACSCNFCSHHQAVGRFGQIAGYEVSYPSVICYHFGRYLYLDWYFDQSGGTWHDIGSRL